VRAAIDYAPCGYCKSCYAYFVNVENLSFEPDALVCKNGALTRRRLAEWRFLYTVNLRKCTGCGACVRTCLRKVIRLFVSPELCDRCGECAARAACRRGAFG
jgi:NAD-dependent dihydropyrimidine dehydrogenase PreA subunit